jgi:hypothetical protein
MNEQLHDSPRVYTLDNIPQAVGYWQLPGGSGAAHIRFTAFTKPRWLTIKMMLWVFEWKWIEADKKTDLADTVVNNLKWAEKFYPEIFDKMLTKLFGHGEKK